MYTTTPIIIKIDRCRLLKRFIYNFKYPTPHECYIYYYKIESNNTSYLIRTENFLKKGMKIGCNITDSPSDKKMYDGKYYQLINSITYLNPADKKLNDTLKNMYLI